MHRGAAVAGLPSPAGAGGPKAHGPGRTTRRRRRCAKGKSARPPATARRPGRVGLRLPDPGQRRAGVGREPDRTALGLLPGGAHVVRAHHGGPHARCGWRRAGAPGRGGCRPPTAATSQSEEVRPLDRPGAPAVVAAGQPEALAGADREHGVDGGIGPPRGAGACRATPRGPRPTGSAGGRRACTSGRRSGGRVAGGCLRGGSASSRSAVTAATSATRRTPPAGLIPLTLRTYWRAAASISSAVAAAQPPLR